MFVRFFMALGKSLLVMAGIISTSWQGTASRIPVYSLGEALVGM